MRPTSDIPLNIKSLSLFFLFFIKTSALLAQNELVHFKNGSTTFQKNIHQLPTVPKADLIENHYYRFLQFAEIPDAHQIKFLNQQGIELLEYIPNQTYIAAIHQDVKTNVLENAGVYSVQTILPNLKIGESLKKISQNPPDHRHRSTIILKYFKNLNQQKILDLCKQHQITVLQSNPYQNYLKADIATQDLFAIAKLPWVAYLDLAPKIGQPDDTRGRNLHRSNTLDTRHNAGRHYDGKGVNVLVRDDGMIGKHLDFQGRIDQTNTRRDLGIHGDGVAGIIAGAGNIDPNIAGMARAAFIYNSMYEPTFLDNTLDFHVNNQVMITNSSYSNDCNVFLPNTQIVDQQMDDFPTLLHVFSAGNSNSTDCHYGAGTEWGNITGGHKQGKNVLTVANVFSDGTIAGSSSRGPAYDGRIKPDLAANGSGQQSTGELFNYQGFGGTSAAAPGVTGVAAQLYQAYRELNNGENPDAALIKACLLNTANDLGNPGPDFKFGWGSVNALKAVKMLEEHRYIQENISQNGLLQHNIVVPAGVRELRVMTYWTDAAGSEMAAKALVNNLNTQIIDDQDHVFRPLVLNSSPNPNLLNLPAVEGIDDLNNMEQIRVANPVAGVHALLVEGVEVPFGAVQYVVVYEFITDEMTLTYPFGGEGIESGKSMQIHWDAAGNDGEFLIEYSINGGDIWSSIVTVAGNKRTYEWLVPAFVTGQAKIRMSRNGVMATNNFPFSIIGVPQQVRVLQVCPDYLRIDWQAVVGATDYTIFYMGEYYMDSIANTTNNFYDIPISSPLDDNNWFAVAANGVNGARGQRTIAKSWIAELRDCVQPYDLKMSAILHRNIESTVLCDEVYEETVSVRVVNKGMLTADSILFGFQIDGQSPVIEMWNDTLAAGDTVVYTFPNPLQIDTSGTYLLKTWVNTPNETAHFNDTLRSIFKVLIYETGDTLPIKEDFESAEIFPDDWVIDNPDTLLTWVDVTTVGSDGQPTNAMLMDNFRYGIERVGQRDAMQLSPVDLSGTTQPVLVFDLAYTYYTGAHWDTLAVEISTDCGATFQTVYEKTKDDLSTVQPSTVRFEPQNGRDWRREIIDLSNYTEEAVFIRLVNKTGWGNSLYIDNIEVLEYNAVTGHFLGIKSIQQPQPQRLFSCDESYQQCVNIFVENYGIDTVNSFEVAYQLHEETILKDTITYILLPEMTYEHTFSTPLTLTQASVYNLMVWVNKVGEEERFRDSVSVEFELVFPTDDVLNLNVFEDFETTESLPEGWLIDNPDEATTWKKVAVIGANGQPSEAMRMENFNYNQPNTEDVLQLPLIDLTLTEGDVPALYFDLAYTYKNVEQTDALRIEVSTDCGVHFDTIFNKAGITLSTTAASGSAFVPDSANDWHKQVLNLSAYAGEQLMIRFININGFGNNLYLDNVEIKPLDFAAPMANFTASETTLCPGDLVFFTDLSSGENRDYFWDFGTGASTPTSTTSGSQVLSFQQAGQQVVTLIVSNAAGADTATLLMNILPIPQADFTFLQTDNTVVFENLSNDTTAVVWDFGDGQISELVAPIHSFQQSGTYTVTLTVANECGESVRSQELTIVISEVEDLDHTSSISLYPNPTTGICYLNTSGEAYGALTARLLTLQGQVWMEKSWLRKATETIFKIDFGNIPEGVYVLEVRESKKTSFFKVVVSFR